MCYSAMVEQDAKKFGFRFKARIQTEMYEDLFRRRLAGEKLLINKAMEIQFTSNPKNSEDREIGKLIKQWHQKKIEELEKDLFAQKKRLADAERSLEKKVTKKAENEIRVASNKIEKFKADLIKHKRPEIQSETEERIFPSHYMSMLCLNEKREMVVMPVRYLMRPHDKDESFDVKFNGCYNARLDSLDSVRWWKDGLGKRHGLILVKKFYENVDPVDYAKKFKLPKGTEDRKSMVLCFEPENTEYMFIPTIWDVWSKKGQPELYSAALITDEPEPEIAAAGHDRTPIFLKESAVEGWLNATGTSAKGLEQILNQREHPGYSHRVVGAA